MIGGPEHDQGVPIDDTRPIVFEHVTTGDERAVACPWRYRPHGDVSAARGLTPPGEEQAPSASRGLSGAQSTNRPGLQPDGHHSRITTPETPRRPFDHAISPWPATIGLWTIWLIVAVVLCNTMLRP